MGFWLFREKKPVFSLLKPHFEPWTMPRQKQRKSEVNCAVNWEIIVIVEHIFHSKGRYKFKSNCRSDLKLSIQRQMLVSIKRREQIHFWLWIFRRDERSKSQIVMQWTLTFQRMTLRFQLFALPVTGTNSCWVMGTNLSFSKKKIELNKVCNRFQLGGDTNTIRKANIIKE